MLKQIHYPACIACFLILLSITQPLFSVAGKFSFNPEKRVTKTFKTTNADIAPMAFTDKYNEWNLSAAGISYEVFNYAIKGYEYLLQQGSLKNKELLVLIDFSKPSSEERLFILNIKTGKIVFKTLVAHGRNTGLQYATAFSNQPSSLESSLGFYITMDTYNGGNGYSLKLKGCEKGFNDKALDRNIVMHGASYVSENFIQKNGFLGRSHGCPAVPVASCNKIINTIKSGTCLFIYHPNKKYLQQSVFINR